MDRSHMSAADLSKRVDDLCNQIIKSFQNILVASVETENNDYAATAQNELYISTQTSSIVKDVQSLSTLIRELQDLFLFGSLDTLADPADEEANKDKALRVAALVEKLTKSGLFSEKDTASLNGGSSETEASQDSNDEGSVRLEASIENPREDADINDNDEDQVHYVSASASSAIGITDTQTSASGQTVTPTTPHAAMAAAPLRSSGPVHAPSPLSPLPHTPPSGGPPPSRSTVQASQFEPLALRLGNASRELGGSASQAVPPPPPRKLTLEEVFQQIVEESKRDARAP